MHFHIFTHTVRKIYTFSVLHIVPSVQDYLCEPSQHAAPSHEQLSEQSCGDLYLHSPGTPSSPQTLIPALGATKCQAIHRCQWSATEMLTFSMSSTSNLVLLSLKVQAIVLVMTAVWRLTASRLSKQRTKWRPTSWPTTTE